MSKFLHFILSSLPENNRLERIWKIAQVDFKKRYYNDKLGLLWAFFNPIIQTLIYYSVFNVVFKRSIEEIPNYGLYIFSGLIIWMSFVENIRKGMFVLQSKLYLIENIQVRKVDLFISNSFSILFGSFFNILGYLAIALLFGIKFSFLILYIIPIVLITSLMGLGAGMILSIVHIFLKDVNHILDIIILLGFWSSGIFFSPEIILETYPGFVYLNPFIGLIDNMHKVALFNLPVNWYYMCISFIWSLVLTGLGYLLVSSKGHLIVEYK